jgi:hypothetical protein
VADAIVFRAQRQRVANHVEQLLLAGEEARVLEGAQLVIVGFLLILVGGQVKFILFHTPS